MIVNKINQGDTWIPSAQALNTLINSANRMAPIGAGDETGRLTCHNIKVLVFNPMPSSFPMHTAVALIENYFVDGQPYLGPVPLPSLPEDCSAPYFPIFQIYQYQRGNLLGLTAEEIPAQGFGECIVYGPVDVELDETYIEGSRFAIPTFSNTKCTSSANEGWRVLKRYDKDDIRYATVFIDGPFLKNEKQICICGEDSSGNPVNLRRYDQIVVQDIKTDLSGLSTLPPLDALVFRAKRVYNTSSSVGHEYYLGRTAVVTTAANGSAAIGFASMSGEWDIVGIGSTNPSITGYTYCYHADEPPECALYLRGSSTISDYGASKIIHIFSFDNYYYAIVNRAISREQSQRGAFDVRFNINGSSVTLLVFDSSNPNNTNAGSVKSGPAVPKKSFALSELSFTSSSTSTIVVYVLLSYTVQTNTLTAEICQGRSLPSPSAIGAAVRTYPIELATVTKTGQFYEIFLARHLGALDAWGVYL